MLVSYDCYHVLSIHVTESRNTFSAQIYQQRYMLSSYAWTSLQAVFVIDVCAAFDQCSGVGACMVMSCMLIYQVFMLIVMLAMERLLKTSAEACNQQDFDVSKQPENLNAWYGNTESQVGKDVTSHVLRWTGPQSQKLCASKSFLLGNCLASPGRCFNTWFGDPCPGQIKQLILQVCGGSFKAMSEIHINNVPGLSANHHFWRRNPDIRKPLWHIYFYVNQRNMFCNTAAVLSRTNPKGGAWRALPGGDHDHA